MPEADTATQHKLLIHQFLMGLPAEISKQLLATVEIEQLDKLVKCPRLLMILTEKEKLDNTDQTQTSLKPLQSLQVAALTEQVAM